MRSRPRQVVFMLSLLTFSAALGGCGDPGQELDGADPGVDPAAGNSESAEQSLLSTQRDIPVGNGYIRKQRTLCGKVCVKSELRPGKPRPYYKCVKEVESCSGPPVGVILSADEAGRAANAPFPPYNGGQPYDYVGCGRSAVLNVLGYFGVPITMNVVQGYVQVSKFGRFWKDDLGSYDNWVADGLRYLLNNFHPDNFAVDIHNWTDVYGTVTRELRAGNPVIMLVKGGSHWVTAVGYEGGDIYYIDYPWMGVQKAPFNELETSFEDGGDLINRLHGWKSNTVITIRRY